MKPRGNRSPRWVFLKFMKHPERINHIFNVLFCEWGIINFKNTHLGERLNHVFGYKLII